MKKKLIIATRDSALALWQADWVADTVVKHFPDVTVELLKMKTQGDIILDTPLSKIGGKGLFVKELEVAMLAGKADIAVHSLKDVPAYLPEGLELSVITEREVPDDAFVCNKYDSLLDLPQGAVVGTSSLRRAAQVKRARPDLKIESLRGNVNTRLRKLDEGQYDAIILAAAGLIRLKMFDRIKERLNHEICLPALGQGIVGIETRVGDTETLALLAPLSHKDTDTIATCERAVMKRLNGGCQVPFAGQAHLDGDTIHIEALVSNPEGEVLIRLKESGPASDPAAVGTKVAENLLAAGARKILSDLGIETH